MWGVDGAHVVGAQVRAAIDHAAFQSGDVDAWKLGPRVQMAFNAVPLGFVVPARDHQRAPRVHNAIHLDGALGHADGQPMLEYGGKRRRACIGLVAHQIRVGRSPLCFRLRAHIGGGFYGQGRE